MLPRILEMPRNIQIKPMINAGINVAIFILRSCVLVYFNIYGGIKQGGLSDILISPQGKLS